ncbi:MAG TPA: cytochrome c family protein [Candidatus Competibacter sp.]|nr:cytochrome c family protein [Candidatus Competibacteraceae bacterium]HRC73235.1 cytochrome c family protein [Candidatus Competibacter sp.]
MHEHLWRPIWAIAVAFLVLGGTLWVIDPLNGLFSLLAPAASAKHAYRYPAIPVGLDSPAGQCVVCHSIEKHGPLRVAPNLWGIVGAPKAGSKGYGYSHALLEAGGVWTEQELNDYLTAPDKFLPGTKKTLLGLPNAVERAKLIEFLATLKD